MTAAEGVSEVLNEAEADVRLALPIAAEATEVLLLEEVERDSTWWKTRALAFHSASEREAG